MSHRPTPREGASSPPNDAGEELGFDLPEPARLSSRRVLAGVGIAVVLLGAAFTAAYLPKRHARDEVVADAQRTSSRHLRVQVVSPTPKKSDRAVRLPGDVQPLQEAIVYPRANGYVNRRFVDIGDQVEPDEVLAEIDTPELDQQIGQARAELARAKAQVTQATANREFARASLRRYQELAPNGVASQQELDQKQAEASVADASVTVANANVEAQASALGRLLQLKSFAQVRAPFAGTINERMTGRGWLVTPSTPLFRLTETTIVRVFVQVPQELASNVAAEMPAVVSVRELGDRVFRGTVSRSARALDAATRTMRTEIRVPNPDGALLGGMYAQVALTLPTPHRILEVPATALMNDASGLRVATVDREGRIHLAPVVVERDTGSTIEVASGLADGDRVVKLASAELVEGREVEIAVDAKAGEGKPAAK